LSQIDSDESAADDS